MLRAILPPSNQKGDAALMFGLDAAAPSGLPSAELMHLMHSAAGSQWFRWKVIMWSWVRRLGPFDWDAFQVSLKEAEFREYRDNWEAKRSIGWAGQNPENSSPQWLFGVCVPARQAWLIGRSIVDHELFHAVQDLQSGGRLFRPAVPLRWSGDVLVEAEALVFGSPLIGVPFLGLLLVCLAGAGWMLWALIGVFL
ncbi:MAG TPA: hypothetical protein VKI65_10315 [Gemmataceae bacterium]|nr:hypothetical protein [Gemmataceae bacterium]